MAKLGKIEQNPLNQPRVSSKWYHIDALQVTVEKCRACGEPVTLTEADLSAGRYIKCKCGRGCFELELRLVHTVQA